MSRHGLLYLTGAAVQGLAVLLATPFATRVLGPSEYGSVAVAIVVVQMTATVLAAGFPQLILRDYQRGEEGHQSAKLFVGILGSGGIVLAGIGGVVLVALVASGRTDEAVQLATVVVAAGALTCVIAGQSLFRAQGRPVGFLALAMGSTLGALMVGIMAASLRPRSSVFMLGYVAALAVVAFVAIVLSKPVWPWRDRARARFSLGSAASMLPHGAAMLVLLSGDTVMASVASGPAAAGTYQPALLLGNVAFVGATAFYNAWGPAVYRQRPAIRWEWAVQSNLLLLLLVTAAGCLVVAVSPIAVPLLVGAQFDLGTITALVSVLAWTAVPYVAYLLWSLILVESGRTGLLAGVSAAVAFLFVLVGLVNVELVGLRGLAFAKVASYLLLAVVTGLLVHRAKVGAMGRGLIALVVSVPAGVMLAGLVAGLDLAVTVAVVALLPVCGGIFVQRARLARVGNEE